MFSTTKRRPGPALIVALIALVAALSGSAIALPGRNSVDAGDLKKNAVGKQELKKDGVGKAEVKKAAIATGEIADGAVAEADLAVAEPFHRVGVTGEPAFETGVEGDCVWANPGPPIAIQGLNPAAFYRDPYGVVHLSGFVSGTDAAGGDGACGGTDAVEDGIVFILPAGYRPENAELHSTGSLVALIAPDEGAAINGETVPPGAVVATSPPPANQQGLDGITFRAAGAGTAGIEAASAPARAASLRAVRETLR
jgi:hypothetical protein